MKIFKYILILLLFLCVGLPIYSQDNSAPIDRTPEQEAVKQTDKLKQELNLSPEQTKQVYEINLRYARERQISNTRSEAMERVKNKNAELQAVLNEDQNNRLENKRYERTTVEISNGSSIRSSISTSFRSSARYRPNPPAQTLTTDLTVPSGSHSVNSQVQSNSQTPQSVRRSTSTSNRNEQINTESRSSSRPQTVSPSTSRKTDTQSNSNRR